MTRLQKLVNSITLSSYLIQLLLYRITRIIGSRLMLVPLIGGVVIVLLAKSPEEFQRLASGFVVCFVVWVACKMAYPKLKPGDPPRLYQPPAPPPPPPPSARTAGRRTDDPDEATVISRLDPKLRALLHQKVNTKR